MQPIGSEITSNFDVGQSLEFVALKFKHETNNIYQEIFTCSQECHH